MKIFIDNEPLLKTLKDHLAVEFTKGKKDIVTSSIEDWINCYRKLYPNANIYYRGV